jgi:hypothetical protein
LGCSAARSQGRRCQAGANPRASSFRLALGLASSLHNGFTIGDKPLPHLSVSEPSLRTTNTLENLNREFRRRRTTRRDRCSREGDSSWVASASVPIQVQVMRSACSPDAPRHADWLELATLICVSSSVLPER